MTVGTHDMTGKSQVKCHQVLHGYNDGHQLLASSLSLPRSVRTRMLLLTDFSGPSVVKGFESYLTGYPLPYEGLYALSRTWYAEEMPRPGCVWTHTLLLSGETFALLSDLSALTRLFSRPTEKDVAEDFVAYKAHIAVDVEFKRLPLAFEGIEERVRNLVAVLYGQPEANVVIGARSAADLEQAVLAIWSQQWPQLRQSFSFCTGSLGRRGSVDVRFDLQVVPEAHVRQFRRDTDPYAFVVEEVIEQTPEGTDWVDATFNNMVSSGQDDLRKFMWKFGPDQQDGRAVFQTLYQIYMRVQLEF